MEPTQQNSSLVVPIAIIIGFTLIALAIYFSGIGRQTVVSDVKSNPNTNTPVSEIRVVDESDYILGNPNAPILLVVYSDYDCSFCKRYHETMKQIMDEYGVNGKVAWVYRQFPIAQLHPNSPRISEAALCVGEAGGNRAFWKFSDTVFAERNINESTNMTKLVDFAVEAGVDRDTYETCVRSGRHQQRIAESLMDGYEAGVTGVPHSFVIVGNQKQSIIGAEPYPVMKGIIENLIKQLEGTGQ